MITLRSITGKEFFLNSDLIYRIDENFDTIITLTNGKTLPVADTGVEITEKVIAFKREIMSAFILERKDSWSLKIKSKSIMTNTRGFIMF